MLLGKKTSYPQTYDPSVLFKVERSEKRSDINYSDEEIYGYDLWTCYEISCLDETGKPHVFIGILYYDSDSKYIVESKSLKLYLNSFNMTKLNSKEEFEKIVIKDLSDLLEISVDFSLCDLDEFNVFQPVSKIDGENIDYLQCDNFVYEVDPSILEIDKQSNFLHINSNLLRSNCLVTGQPDWGSVEIYITGEVPTKESLLKYIVSFRNHQEFHEQCVERIISTLKDKFDIESCFVRANYTRRGGIDINPVRTYNNSPDFWTRQVRQ